MGHFSSFFSNLFSHENKCAQEKKKKMRYKFLNYLAYLVYGNHTSVWLVAVLTGYMLTSQ